MVPDRHHTTDGVAYPSPSTPMVRPLGSVFSDKAYSIEKYAVKFPGAAQLIAWFWLPPSDQFRNVYRVEPFTCGESAVIVRFVAGSHENENGARAAVPFTSMRREAGEGAITIVFAFGFEGGGSARASLVGTMSARSATRVRSPAQHTRRIPHAPDSLMAAAACNALRFREGGLVFLGLPGFL